MIPVFNSPGLAIGMLLPAAIMRVRIALSLLLPVTAWPDRGDHNVFEASRLRSVRLQLIPIGTAVLEKGSLWTSSLFHFS
jgi:hypothetical protein